MHVEALVLDRHHGVGQLARDLADGHVVGRMAEGGKRVERRQLPVGGQDGDGGQQRAADHGEHQQLDEGGPEAFHGTYCASRVRQGASPAAASCSSGIAAGVAAAVDMIRIFRLAAGPVEGNSMLFPPAMSKIKSSRDQWIPGPPQASYQ
ncbi:hypothetical protein D9M72_420160 [compost metagenome]